MNILVILDRSRGSRNILTSYGAPRGYTAALIGCYHGKVLADLAATRGTLNLP